MQNLNQPLPVKQLNLQGPTAVRVTPLASAMVQPAAQLFQGQVSVSPIPQGGSFALEIPIPFK